MVKLTAKLMVATLSVETVIVTELSSSAGHKVRAILLAFLEEKILNVNNEIIHSSPAYSCAQ